MERAESLGTDSYTYFFKIHSGGSSDVDEDDDDDDEYGDDVTVILHT